MCRVMCVLLYIRCAFLKISARINVRMADTVGGFSMITAVSSYTSQ